MQLFKKIGSIRSECVILRKKLPVGIFSQALIKKHWNLTEKYMKLFLFSRKANMLSENKFQMYSIFAQELT